MVRCAIELDRCVYFFFGLHICRQKANIIIWVPVAAAYSSFLGWCHCKCWFKMVQEKSRQPTHMLDHVWTVEPMLSSKPTQLWSAQQYIPTSRMSKLRDSSLHNKLEKRFRLLYMRRKWNNSCLNSWPWSSEQGELMVALSNGKCCKLSIFSCWSRNVIQAIFKSTHKFVFLRGLWRWSWHMPGWKSWLRWSDALVKEIAMSCHIKGNATFQKLMANWRQAARRQVCPLGTGDSSFLSAESCSTWSCWNN